MTPPGALLFPVTAIVARAWAQGWIGDCELMLSDPGTEAVYFQTLPDLASFRRVLPLFTEYHRRGASTVILRTDSPAVVHHLAKWGGVRTWQDPSGRWRWLVPPEAVTRYFGRILQKSAASSGVISVPSAQLSSR